MMDVETERARAFQDEALAPATVNLELPPGVALPCFLAREGETDTMTAHTVDDFWRYHAAGWKPKGAHR